MKTHVHLAQVNIGRIKGPIDGPTMAGFVARLDEINALADRSPGFVWRLQTDAGNATYFRPYDDDRILVNMSVWEGASTRSGRSCTARDTSRCSGDVATGSLG
jgi:hypothetical protein